MTRLFLSVIVLGLPLVAVQVAISRHYDDTPTLELTADSGVSEHQRCGDTSCTSDRVIERHAATLASDVVEQLHQPTAGTNDTARASAETTASQVPERRSDLRDLTGSGRTTRPPSANGWRTAADPDPLLGSSFLRALHRQYGHQHRAVHEGRAV